MDLIAVLPDDDLAIAVVTNVGGRDMGERACRELTAAALERLGVLPTGTSPGKARR